MIPWQQNKFVKPLALIFYNLKWLIPSSKEHGCQILTSTWHAAAYLLKEQRWELIVKEANSVLRGEAKQQLEPTKNHYNGFLRKEIFLSNNFYKHVH